MICVVEDNSEISDLWVAICASAGYDVETFRDAESMLAQFTPGRYQGALIDLGLPGLGGGHLGDELKVRDHDLPLIAITGGLTRQSPSSLTPPFEMVLIKPVARTDLMLVMEKYFVKRE